MCDDFFTVSLASMELLCLPVSVFSAVAAALLSRGIPWLWLRAFVVVTAAYGATSLSLAELSRLNQDGQFASWASVLLNFAFAAGSVIGVGALLTSHWLLKPRKPHAG